MSGIKETFYRAVNAYTIRNLLRVIKNYTDEKYIEDVLVELRELKDDSYQQDEFQEVISVMSKEKKLCTICGYKLIYKTDKIIHTELPTDDPNRYEGMIFLYCEECGFDDLDNED